MRNWKRDNKFLVKRGILLGFDFSEVDAVSKNHESWK
jgi:hypothetical protein